jgi:DNA topoisomerase-1
MNKVLSTRYDKKGRKQTVYQPWFVERQRNIKFKRVMAFGNTFTKINKYVKNIISNNSKNIDIKERLICIIIRLMILCNFRIGSHRYTRENGTYGLTTLQWKHIKFNKSSVFISFVGKKGVINEANVTDKDVINALRKLHKYAQDKCVFYYTRCITAKDVNEYIAQFDAKCTCKDIRTWRANALFVKYFNELSEEKNEKKRQYLAIKKVATDLHNTPNVCIKSYICPALLLIA